MFLINNITNGITITFNNNNNIIRKENISLIHTLDREWILLQISFSSKEFENVFIAVFQ
jgi:hypothetical protein